MSERLKNLEEFYVKNCDTLEEIFEAQVLNADESHVATTTTQSITEETNKFVFPKLTKL